MNSKIFAFLAFLALFSAALGTPTSGDITLRLRDSQQRPVVNASVTFEYTVTDPVLGELHKTDVHYSNQFGVLEKRLNADFNTYYKITISHHNYEEVTDSIWIGGFDRFVNLPLSDFSVRVIDSQANPIANVPLRVEVLDGGEFTTAVNATGYKIFSQYNHDLIYTVYAQYGGVETPIEVVPDGRPHTIQIKTYSLEVRTYDEDGSPVVSTMKAEYNAVGEQSKTASGVAGLFTQLPEGNVSLTLRYGNSTIKDTIYLNASITSQYFFDVSPPIISPPILTPEKPVAENDVLVTVRIIDRGRNSSGMPPLINMIPPAELYYSLDSVTWKSVHMFPQEDNQTYVGRIPGQPRDSVVRYYIEAWDNTNNTARSEQYTFNTFSDGGNGTSNGNGPEIDPFAALAEFWWVPVIALFAALAYYLKQRYL